MNMFEKKKIASGPTLVVGCPGCREGGYMAGKMAAAIEQDGFARGLDVTDVEQGEDAALARARRSAGIMVIDGCDKGCARKILESHLGPMPHVFVLTDDQWRMSHPHDAGQDAFENLKRRIKIGYAQNRMLMASMCTCGCARG
jgi:uncharacterized metal-binding protein